MSRSEVDALRKDESLQLLEHLGEVQPRRGVLVLELRAMIKDLLFSEKGETRKTFLGICKDEQEPAGGQGTAATDFSIREPNEKTSDQYYKGKTLCSSQHGRTRTTWVSASTEPRRIKKFYRWITNTAVGSIKWRISSPTGNSRDSRRG